jgi:hypothetical protein
MSDREPPKLENTEDPKSAARNRHKRRATMFGDNADPSDKPVMLIVKRTHDHAGRRKRIEQVKLMAENMYIGCRPYNSLRGAARRGPMAMPLRGVSEPKY